MITVFTEGSPPNKESAEPRLAQAIGGDYVNGRARSDNPEVVADACLRLCYSVALLLTNPVSSSMKEFNIFVGSFLF